jgi:hypothetical protein
MKRHKTQHSGAYIWDRFNSQSIIVFRIERHFTPSKKDCYIFCYWSWHGEKFDRGSIPSGERDLFLLHVLQTRPGARSASHPMDPGGCLPSGKVVQAWIWQLTCIYCRS